MKGKTFHEIEYQAWSDRASQYDKLFASVSQQAGRDILRSLGSLQGKRHLDVASGTGHLVAAASRQGAISDGIDFSPAMVVVAQTNYPSKRFQIADAVSLPYEDAAFDLVTCSFGLSHLDNPQAAVDEAFRVLKPDGCLAFTLWFGPEQGNEQRGMIQTALEKHATTDFALPEGWMLLRNADKGACEELTQKAGFGSPVFKRLPIVWQANSAQDVVDLLLKLSVRNKLMIEQQSVEVRGHIYEHILSEAESRMTNGSISINMPALLTVVKKPQASRGRKFFGHFEPKYIRPFKK
jgi:ubiquinone/menaquinone biosynthesis C-methylase UbiE